MRYEPPELTALPPTINSINASCGKVSIHLESPLLASNDVISGYMDWEE